MYPIKRRNRWLVIGLSVLVAIAHGWVMYIPIARAEEPKGILLGQSELEQLYKNERSYNFRNSEGLSGTTTCFPNGNQNINWKTAKAAGSDTGTYRIINGQKCDKWEDTFSAQERCYKFYKINENEYSTVCTNCSDNSIVTFK